MGWRQIQRAIQQQGRGTLQAFDLFNGTDGTNLSAHTPDKGTSWTQDDANTMEIWNNRACKPGGTLALRKYLMTPAMPSADVHLEFKVNAVTVLSSSYIGGHFRVNTSTGDGYLVALFSDGTDVFLTFYTLDGNAPTTEIETSGAIAVTAGQEFQVVFEMEGNAYVGYVDGVEVISGTNSFQAGGGSNNNWGAAAYFAGTNTTGLHLEDLYLKSL